MSFGENSTMSTDASAALASEAPPVEDEVKVANNEWFATALTILFTATAVLFVSFIAVVTGLI
jgi:hypothetical protein